MAWRPKKNSKLPEFRCNMWPCNRHLESCPTSNNVCHECSLEYHRRLYTKYGQSLSGRYNTLVQNSRKRFGKDPDISYDQFVEIVSLPCAYAFEPGDDIRIGIDRKDSTLGYTIENSLPCCARHNRLKNNILTYEQTLDAVQRYEVQCGNGEKKRIIPNENNKGNGRVILNRTKTRIRTTGGVDFPFGYNVESRQT